MAWLLPPRTAAPETLQVLIQAVRNREAIEIRYQSMTDPKASWRWISPHAFASDGRRWHVRAYCHTRKDFRDFVIGRIETTRKRKPSEIEPELDHDWHTRIDVTLIPNPALSLEQQEAIAYEYRMSRSKQLKLSVRKSLLFYLERQLAWAPETPEARQIVISYD
ncbi:WYL domain-containing protein [Methylocaldum sp.]|jgi:predicted DNA-binding transcriptional regulator YafY|uniref:helix-turn-helix transcriptional regulator n=1 Tax=Methylocaldum sp. TaxID=1969727 RepID=UPI00321FA9F2